jgi:hypothetical protein
LWYVVKLGELWLKVLKRPKWLLLTSF